MSHTYAHLLVHVIFSTKARESLLDPDLKARLLPYMGGMLRETGCSPMIINGPADHVHILLSCPATTALADVMRILKTNSSRWVHEQWPDRAAFSWQTGYAAFSVSQSNVGQVTRYIAEQEVHHTRIPFQDEFRAFLKRHGIQFDERYVWD